MAALLKDLWSTVKIPSVVGKCGRRVRKRDIIAEMQAENEDLSRKLEEEKMVSDDLRWKLEEEKLVSEVLRRRLEEEKQARDQLKNENMELEQKLLNSQHTSEERKDLIAVSKAYILAQRKQVQVSARNELIQRDRARYHKRRVRFASAMLNEKEAKIEELQLDVFVLNHAINVIKNDYYYAPKDAFVRPAKCQNESGPSEVRHVEVKGIPIAPKEKKITDAFVRPAKCQNESGPSEVRHVEVKGIPMAPKEKKIMDAFVRPAKCQNESGPSEVCQFEVKGMSMEDILSPKNLEDDAFFAETLDDFEAFRGNKGPKSPSDTTTEKVTQGSDEKVSSLEHTLNFETHGEKERQDWQGVAKGEVSDDVLAKTHSCSLGLASPHVAAEQDPNMFSAIGEEEDSDWGEEELHPLQDVSPEHFCGIGPVDPWILRKEFRNAFVAKDLEGALAEFKRLAENEFLVIQDYRGFRDYERMVYHIAAAPNRLLRIRMEVMRKPAQVSDLELWAHFA